MSFKSEIAADRSVFFDLDFFAEQHDIDGNLIDCIIDDDDSKAGGGKILGVSENQKRIFARVEDLHIKRLPGATLKVDGKLEIVDDWKEDAGVLEIVLKKAVAS